MRSPDLHRAKKSLGQNFLVDPNLQRKIVDALGAGPSDTVVEIGPGQGALTGHLEGRVRKLVLVELDDDLAVRLEERFSGRDDVTVIRNDILRVRLAEHLPDPESARVVGNIPYNITTPILFHLLERPRPREIVLMVQDEVARRLVAEPGSKAYGALSVGVQAIAEVERLFGVGRRAFRPVPKVDSAVVRVRPRRPEELSGEEERQLRRVVRSVFQHRRKQLGKILREHPELGLERARVDELAEAVPFSPTDRPERLEPAAFVRIARLLA